MLPAMNKRGLAVAAGGALFLGSALLFNVQPMTGRLLLPRFGGSAAVWTACLVAFQLLLLAGYAYAALISRLRPLQQVLAHSLLLAAAAAWPGVSRLAATASADPLPPVLRVLLLVMAGTGPAYLLLAAGSTLLQSWLARAMPGWNVYQLYAVSNAGSLIGLFAYPLLVEPYVSLPVQQAVWRGLFAGYGLLLAGLAVVLLRKGGTGASRLQEEEEQSGTGASRLQGNPHWWWILPLLSSFLLTAATACLTQDITPMPMVWCLLLGAFLLSYVVGFSRVGETQTPLWGLLAVAFMAVFALFRGQGWGSLTLLLFLGAGVVLFGGLFLCGRLYAARPPAGRLPVYYLAIAAGGAGGGLLAGVVAPLLLKGVFEYGAIALALALLIAFFTFQQRRKIDSVEVWLTALAALAVGVFEPLIFGSQVSHSIWRNRNFYAVLRVSDSPVTSKYGDQLGRMHCLVHGSTVHGFQTLTATQRDVPTQYYGHNGGGYPIRRQLALHPKQALRVGVVGLGTGTLAAYGREGDTVRFYELNPQVAEVAWNTNLFTYLADSPARVEVVMGDARLSLERERAAGEAPWDVLVVDAFSGDSVPMHLLTREAVALFLARTAPEGQAVFHISNRFIDLLPLLKAAARDQGVRFFAWHNRVAQGQMESDSRWVVLTRSAAAFGTSGNMVAISEADIPPFPLMTDERGSVLHLIDWGQSRMEAYLHHPGGGRGSGAFADPRPDGRNGGHR